MSPNSPSTTGLLLYNGRFNGKHDFISLAVVEEGVRFSFSTGQEAAVVTVRRPGGVSDGLWHKVEIQYHNRFVPSTVQTLLQNFLKSTNGK
jgi:cadherin EGF LAG seven-pass G-type receptor 1